VAFVNKQAGDQAESGRAASGQPIDFDPNDPDVVKVHYDVSVWTFDQRAELSEALADAEFPHYWDGDELVVPEAVEDDVDALFERLEQLFGPFPIVLQDDRTNRPSSASTNGPTPIAPCSPTRWSTPRSRTGGRAPP
jgi:hypothetical protein